MSSQLRRVTVFQVFNAKDSMKADYLIRFKGTYFKDRYQFGVVVPDVCKPAFYQSFHAPWDRVLSGVTQRFAIKPDFYEVFVDYFGELGELTEEYYDPALSVGSEEYLERLRVSPLFRKVEQLRSVAK